MNPTVLGVLRAVAFDGVLWTRCASDYYFVIDTYRALSFAAASQPWPRKNASACGFMTCAARSTEVTFELPP